MRRLLPRFLPLIAIAIALALFFALGLHRVFSFETLRAQRDALDAFVGEHKLIAVVLYMAVFIGAVTLSIPASAVCTITGGFLFGALTAAPLAVACATIGSTLFYYAARSALGAFLRERARGWIARLEDGFRANAFNYILAIRLMPVAPLAVVNISAGALDVNPRAFIAATALGLAPISIVFALVGEGLRAAFEAGTDADPAAAAQRLIFSPQVILPIAGLIALALAPVALKRLRKA